MRFTVPLCRVVIDDGVEPTITALLEDTINRRFRIRCVNVDDDGMQRCDDRRDSSSFMPNRIIVSHIGSAAGRN